MARKLYSVESFLKLLDGVLQAASEAMSTETQKVYDRYAAIVCKYHRQLHPTKKDCNHDH